MQNSRKIYKTLQMQGGESQKLPRVHQHHMVRRYGNFGCEAKLQMVTHTTSLVGRYRNLRGDRAVRSRQTPHRKQLISQSALKYIYNWSCAIAS